jgi:hypothetical protein
MTTVFVLVSEGEENTVVISAHTKISDALSARERYIDEIWAGENIEIQNVNGDEPASAVNIVNAKTEEIVETLEVQAVELN